MSSLKKILCAFVVLVSIVIVTGCGGGGGGGGGDDRENIAPKELAGLYLNIGGLELRFLENNNIAFYNPSGRAGSAFGGDTYYWPMAVVEGGYSYKITGPESAVIRFWGRGEWGDGLDHESRLFVGESGSEAAVTESDPAMISIRFNAMGSVQIQQVDVSLRSPALSDPKLGVAHVVFDADVAGYLRRADDSSPPIAYDPNEDAAPSQDGDFVTTTFDNDHLRLYNGGGEFLRYVFTASTYTKPGNDPLENPITESGRYQLLTPPDWNPESSGDYVLTYPRGESFYRDLLVLDMTGDATGIEDKEYTLIFTSKVPSGGQIYHSGDYTLNSGEEGIFILEKR